MTNDDRIITFHWCWRGGCPFTINKVLHRRTFFGACNGEIAFIGQEVIGQAAAVNIERNLRCIWRCSIENKRQRAAARSVACCIGLTNDDRIVAFHRCWRGGCPFPIGKVLHRRTFFGTCNGEIAFIGQEVIRQAAAVGIERNLRRIWRCSIESKRQCAAARSVACCIGLTNDDRIVAFHWCWRGGCPFTINKVLHRRVFFSACNGEITFIGQEVIRQAAAVGIERNLRGIWRCRIESKRQRATLR